MHHQNKRHPLSICLFWLFFLVSQALQAQTDTIYIVDKQPQFPGGDKALSEYWTRAFRVPTKYRFRPVQGEGQVHFTIDATGALRDVFIKKSLNPELDANAVAAIEKMPRWLPAMREGKAVAMGYQMSFWVTNTNGTRLTQIDLANETQKRGFFFGMWVGIMPHTGDLGSYFNPMRGNLGLTLVGYTYNRWQASAEYDFFSISKVKKAFQIDGKTATTDMRISPINFYFPISYEIKQTGDWTFRPYLAPTINGLDAQYLETVGSTQQYKTIGSLSAFSVSTGVCADKVLSRRKHLKLNGKYRYEVGILRTRLNVNPFRFSESNSTQLKGTAISLSVGLFGQFLKPK